MRMGLITRGATQGAANDCSMSKPLLGFEDGVRIIHALIEHGKLDSSDRLARDVLEPINASCHMGCQVRQLTSPMRVLWK